MLRSILRKIGLTDKDAQVYLACLELGNQPASIIAKKAGLKRPTTYLILEGLLKKGLVSEYNGSNVKYFSPIPPDDLLMYVERQEKELRSHKRELEEYLPQLQSLTNPYSVVPKVRFFDGLEGVRKVMYETLTSSEPLRCFSDMGSWFLRKETKELILQYGKDRVKKGIPVRSINPDTEVSRRYLEEDYPNVKRDPNTSHFRWLPKEIQVFSNEINIFDNKVTIACLSGHELMGVLIESESIAETQKSIFDAAWMAAIPAKWEEEQLKAKKRNS